MLAMRNFVFSDSHVFRTLTFKFNNRRITMRNVFTGLGVLCMALAVLPYVFGVSFAAKPERGKVCFETRAETPSQPVVCQNNACSPTTVLLVYNKLGECRKAPLEDLCDSFCQITEVPDWIRTRYEAAWTDKGNFYRWRDTTFTWACHVGTGATAGKIYIQVYLLANNPPLGAGTVVLAIATAITCYLGSPYFDNDYCKGGHVVCQQVGSTVKSTWMRQSCK
jgi:hypothetical protein